MSNIDFTALVKENRRASDDYIRSTAWAKKFEKEWAEYKRLPRCQKLSTALAKKLNTGKSHVIQSKRGKGGETWVHPVIAIDFAEWLSTDFGIFVKEVFLRYLDGDSDLAFEILLRDHNKDRQARALRRLNVVETNKSAADVVGGSCHSIAMMHDDRYRGLYRKNTRQLREECNAKPKETPLNYMSERDLAYNYAVNLMVIESGDPNKAFEGGRGMADLHEKVTGKPLSPEWKGSCLAPSTARAALNGQLELPVVR